MSFREYNNILFGGFRDNVKSAEIINKKASILKEVLDYYKVSDDNILFVGFNPYIFALGGKTFKIAEVADEVLDYLTANGCSFEHVEITNLLPKSVEVVIAADEYFTFAESADEQRNLVNQLAHITSGIAVTTLRDYKNQEYKDREFSLPLVVNTKNTSTIYLEHYKYDMCDKSAIYNTVHAISDEYVKHGPFARRNMFFKQMAKFCIDAGATNFLVHKNLMYKSVIKRNCEHVISIKF